MDTSGVRLRRPQKVDGKLRPIVARESSTPENIPILDNLSNSTFSSSSITSPTISNLVNSGNVLDQSEKRSLEIEIELKKLIKRLKKTKFICSINKCIDERKFDYITNLTLEELRMIFLNPLLGTQNAGDRIWPITSMGQKYRRDCWRRVIRGLYGTENSISEDSSSFINDVDSTLTTTITNDESSNDEKNEMSTERFNSRMRMRTLEKHNENYLRQRKGNMTNSYGFEEGLRNSNEPIPQHRHSMFVNEEELKQNSYFNQITLDVNRLGKRLNSTFNESFFPHMMMTTEDKEKIGNFLINETRNIILWILDNNKHLHYYQGFHDIIFTFVLTFLFDQIVHQTNQSNDDRSMIKLDNELINFLQSLTLHHFDDYMAETMTEAQKLLGFIVPLLNEVDEELAERLYLSQHETANFAVSWLVTWMCHDIDSLNYCQQIFEFLLAAKHPKTIIYMCVGIIVLEREKVLENDDFVTLHATLRRLTGSTNLPQLFEKTLEIFAAAPPSTFDGMLDNWSVRKKMLDERSGINSNNNNNHAKTSGTLTVRKHTISFINRPASWAMASVIGIGIMAVIFYSPTTTMITDNHLNIVTKMMNRFF
ncbi:hypothetical protein SNEBB_008523 [Seison nebaliae]|nr:hypothetical protein SNEBB_008523 [Seison nebaliae]